MQSRSPARLSWLKWGAPLAIAVLLGAVVGGLLLDRATARPSAASAGQVPKAQPQNSGLTEIEFSPDAQAHPDSSKIHWTLQLHFNAINLRQYDTWKNTVVQAKQRQLPEAKWKREYESTRDSAIKVHRIEPGPNDSLRLLLSFVSTQKPSDAPSGLKEPCLNWSVVYPVVLDSGAFRVDVTPPGAAVARPC